MTAFMWTTGTTAQLANEFARLRAHNVDVIMSYSIEPTLAESAITAYLNAAHAENLKVMLNVMPLGRNLVYSRGDKTLSAGEVAAITTYASTHADHPALWGFYADDEGLAANYPISTRQQVYDALKAGAPSAQVLEAHYTVMEGSYSPDVHDYFVVHAGPDADHPYVYKYDDAADPLEYGCISKTTGLVTNATNERIALTKFGQNLAGIKTSLDAAGETNYTALLGAFGQTEYGANYRFAMPPDGGIDKMWSEVAANMGTDHSAYFLWWYPDYTGGPTYGEWLEGVGHSGNEAQQAEIAYINQFTTDYPYDLDVILNAVTESVNRRRQRITIGGV